MTKEELEDAAREARIMVAKVTGKPVSDSAYVVYETRTLLISLLGTWWVAMVGDEQPLNYEAITLIPFECYFRHTNDMLAHITRIDGADAVVNLLAAARMDVEIVREDDEPGEDTPQTLN